jgi:hypothetical protein
MHVMMCSVQEVNYSRATPYSLRASASLHMEEYTCKSYRGNHQNFSSQPGQELVRKDERWLWADRDLNPGAHAHAAMAEIKAIPWPMCNVQCTSI